MISTNTPSLPLLSTLVEGAEVPGIPGSTILRVEAPASACLGTPRARVTYTSWLGGEQVTWVKAARG